MRARAVPFLTFFLAGAASVLPGGAATIPASGDDAVIATGLRPSALRVLSAAEHALFRRAFAAAAAGNWTDALALTAGGHNPVARLVLQWRYALDRNSGASFADIDGVMKATSGWPLHGTLQVRAETAMDPDMPPRAILDWFARNVPISGIGHIRLGEALVATGDTARGAAEIRRGWADGSFDTPTEAAILAKDASWLTPESDRARLDALLWRGEYTAARRQVARVDARTAAIANARIALAGGYERARAALDRVADSDDPALLYDWARALRRAGHDDEAHRMLLRIDPGTLTRDHAARWWSEVNIEARDALAAGEAHTALSLVAHAELPPGTAAYAEQQFLGGFIALRPLKDPALALRWFERLDANVSRPISKARAAYWEGRADEALGDTATALAHYRAAAAWPDTFYGQLALARIDPAPSLHVPDSGVEAVPRAALADDTLMPEMRVLADLGLEHDLRLFAAADAAAYPAPGHLKTLLASLTRWGYPEIAVRLAKEASYAGTAMPDYSHPVIALPSYPGPGAAPDPALVLGLIRQETEFDPWAVSSAGARGLMQMMPASARIAARRAGLDFRPDAIMSDRTYNLQLGMVEFAGHLSLWGGSLVLASAGYNAGDGNVRKWLATNGDPRAGADPVDWIEQIPFAETRNYVERVLENTEVYRARLAGRDTPLRILADLYAPQTPPAAVLTVAADPGTGSDPIKAR